jgi:hypothetical protein
MIQLSNGRGQLGEKLKEKIDQHQVDSDVTIYHTWKVPHLYEPKPGEEEEIQKQEYLKLIKYSQDNPDTKIIFISTNSNRPTVYTYYKELAESYLLLNHKKCVILKFPVFIGNGVIKKLKTGELKPYGVTEVITLEKAVDTIFSFVNYDSLKRVFIIDGEKIEAKTIVEILKING